MCTLPYGESLTSATTVPTTGAVVDYGEYKATHTFVATLTGSPSSYNVGCYLSQDGVNWFAAGSISSIGTPTLHVGGRVARYARVDLTALSGGTSPTVSATVAGA
jgi:hypothetical protein